jgi:hypothetical protein
MGGGDFTGNSSVEWSVYGDNVRQHDSTQVGANGRRQHAIDETPAGPLQHFTVDILLPQDPAERQAFIDTLKSELGNGMDPIVVILPIEDVDHGGPRNRAQIRIQWPSRP